MIDPRLRIALVAFICQHDSRNLRSEEINNMSDIELINFRIVPNKYEHPQLLHTAPLVSALIRTHQYNLAAAVINHKCCFINAVDADGHTPLEYALVERHKDLVIHLATKGAEIYKVYVPSFIKGGPKYIENIPPHISIGAIIRGNQPWKVLEDADVVLAGYLYKLLDYSSHL